MKNPFKKGGHGRHHHGSDDDPGHHHHHGRHGHHGRGRLFDYGGLRLVMLTMIAEQPRHGFAFIKLIEERSGGSYSPSPGVIYPTLAWLDDMGYARIDAEAGGRKRYSITPEGEAFLTANRSTAEELAARLGAPQQRGGGRDGSSPIGRAMENLKATIRSRMRRGPIENADAEKIAAALDTAAKSIERI